MKIRLALLFSALAALVACSDFANQNDEFGLNGQERGTTAPASCAGTPLPEALLKPNEGEFSREKMTYNMGLLLTRSVRNFYLQSQSLANEIEDACAVNAPEQAQAQFKKTMLAFASVMGSPVGPLQQDGRYLLDYTYAWPLTNYCGVDKEAIRLAKTGQPNKQLLYNVQGLGALEYLLFESSLQSVCNTRANPDVVAWNQKSAEEKKRDRCELAKAFASSLEEKASRLWAAWNPEGGAFARGLVNGCSYDSVQTALNDISDHMFQIEVVKDKKLAHPLGLRGCDGKCPEEAELKYSDLSLGAVYQNVRALETLYHGSVDPTAKGFGLDDYLRNLGKTELADRFSAALRQASSTAEQLKDQSFQKLINEMDSSLCAQTNRENRLVPVCALYKDIGYVSLIMKTELVSVLGLRPPKGVEGDNDGG